MKNKKSSKKIKYRVDKQSTLWYNKYIKRKGDRKMIITINGRYIGIVDAKQYTVKQLEEAGFTVVYKGVQR